MTRIGRLETLDGGGAAGDAGPDAAGRVLCLAWHAGCLCAGNNNGAVEVRRETPGSAEGCRRDTEVDAGV